jgi:hypothetical protein
LAEPGGKLSRDNSVALEFAQLLGEHFLGGVGQETPELTKPQRAVFE